jgi:heme/copper-type cytochrome/quinol oxidase subunit 2
MIGRGLVPCGLWLLAWLLAGCAGAQSALDPAGDQAMRTESLWTLMLWICGVMYLLVLLFLAASIWRVRRRWSGRRSARARPVRSSDHCFAP